MDGQKILDGLAMANEHARMTAENDRLRARVAELEAQVAALSAEPDDEMVDAYIYAVEFRATYEQNARAAWKAMVTAFLRRRSLP